MIQLIDSWHIWLFISFSKRKISPKKQNLFPKMGFPRNIQKIEFTKLISWFLLVLEKRICLGKRLSAQEISCYCCNNVSKLCTNNTTFLFCETFSFPNLFSERKGTLRSALWIQSSDHSSGIQIEIVFWDYLIFNIFFSFYRRKILPRLQNLYPNVGFPWNVQKIGFTRLIWWFLLVLEKGIVQEKGYLNTKFMLLPQRYLETLQ